MDSSSATTWDRKIILSMEGQKEIKFWAEEFENCHGSRIWKRAPIKDRCYYIFGCGTTWLGRGGVTACRWLG